MKFVFALFIIFAAASSQAAMSASEKACIRSLAEGRNRFNVKVNAKALVRLLGGLKAHKNVLKERTSALLIDYSLSSRVKRAYLVDFKSCDVLENEYVQHGGSTYDKRGKPVTAEADLNHDGILDRCINSDGTRKNMTRPGFAYTNGCHPTKKKGWSDLGNCYGGLNLVGLDKSDDDLTSTGVVLHELISTADNESIKFESQGCPAFPIGKLKRMMSYGIESGFLVFMYTPQCE